MASRYVQELSDLVFSPSAAPAQPIEYGKSLRSSEFDFSEDYRPLNHGAWGKAPLEVLRRWNDVRERIEHNPDWFFQCPDAQSGMLKRVRAMLAEEVGCDVDELVITTNNTTALSSIFASFDWHQDNVVLYFDQLCYPSNLNAMRFLVDSRKELKLSLHAIKATWPISDDELVRKFEAAINEVERKGKRIRMAVFDVIPRVPAVILPWEKLVQVCRRRSIFSMVDGAHAFGQVHLDLRTQQPDAFSSRISKWGYAPRACSFLHVPFRNQAGLHAMPTGSDYDSSSAGQSSRTRWSHEWSFIASSDWSSVFAIPAALEWRKKLGGHEQIRAYCHRLAVDGGKLVAQLLATETLDYTAEQSLTASITNVRLPLSVPSDIAARNRIAGLIQSEQLDRHQTYVPVFIHDDKFYFRISAQVYNNLDDFRYLADALSQICRSLLLHTKL